jgi:hypothetical protein
VVIWIYKEFDSFSFLPISELENRWLWVVEKNRIKDPPVLPISKNLEEPVAFVKHPVQEPTV